MKLKRLNMNKTELRSRAVECERFSNPAYREFTGVLIPDYMATTLVMGLHDSGVTSECQIIRAIYGNDFTISASSFGSNTQHQNPRVQIHGIRIKLGCVK